ncbi:hypothetical protein BP5796_12092 [Coleophoma crateriformis]|uniref:DUF7908 domain-containing protein n=1 Tax=Coleophoma crateriformis TaxID=565419 RepID=A0A3D8QC40_9HELO|nr:hypothetical protein BP5796_12092 [Coleophoma crateriformis]
MVSFLQTALAILAVCRPFQVAAVHESDADEAESCGASTGATEVVTVDYYNIYPVQISSYFSINTEVTIENYGTITVLDAPKTIITTVTATEKIPTTITAVVATPSSSFSTAIPSLIFTPIIFEIRPLIEDQRRYRDHSIYIADNGSLTSTCQDAASFVLNGTHLHSSQGLMSTSNGTSSTIFQPKTSVGGITQKFSLSKSNVLAWRNSAFSLGEARFFLNDFGKVEAVFASSVNTTNLRPVKVVALSAFDCANLSGSNSGSAAIQTASSPGGYQSVLPAATAGTKTPTTAIAVVPTTLVTLSRTSIVGYSSLPPSPQEPSTGASTPGPLYNNSTFSTISSTQSPSETSPVLEISTTTVSSSSTNTSTTALPLVTSVSSIVFNGSSSSSSPTSSLITISASKYGFNSSTIALFPTAFPTSSLATSATILPSDSSANFTYPASTLIISSTARATNSSSFVAATTSTTEYSITTSTLSTSTSSTSSVGVCGDQIAAYFSSGVYSSSISAFCYTYIGIYTTTNTTMTINDFATATATPDMVTVSATMTQTSILDVTKTVYTSSYTGGANAAKRAVETSLPSYLSQYDTAEISSACSCVYVEQTISVTDVVTAIETISTTTTEEPSTTTDLSIALATATEAVTYVSSEKLTCGSTSRGTGSTNTHAATASLQSTIYACVAVCKALSNCRSIQYNYATLNCAPRTLSIEDGALTMALSSSAYYFYDIDCFA